MKTLTLDIPDSVELNEHEVNLLLTEMLYEQGKLTLGQAAPRILGVELTKQTFIEVMGKYGFSIVREVKIHTPQQY